MMGLGAAQVSRNAVDLHAGVAATGIICAMCLLQIGRSCTAHGTEQLCCHMPGSMTLQARRCALSLRHGGQEGRRGSANPAPVCVCSSVRPPGSSLQMRQLERPMTERWGARRRGDLRRVWTPRMRTTACTSSTATRSSTPGSQA